MTFTPTEKVIYVPGDLIVFNGNASPGRVLEHYRIDGQLMYSVIVRRGGESVIHRCISPSMIRPFSLASVEALIGGPSNVQAWDVDSEGRDHQVTVLCNSPENATA